ncbi:MAG: hypothetical protein WBA13_18565 [Microcoleaceae cyanobacterium]
MGNPSKYWKLVKLKISGGYTISEMTDAKVFFTHVFPEVVSQMQIQQHQVESQLMQWVHQSEPKHQSDKAELCLLCLISGEILLVCRHLEERFGTTHGFNCQDLLPFVLDESGTGVSQTSSYLSFSRQIMQSFDPQQSSLATWTNRKVKFHPELNHFLLERGVYQVSNWAILNDTKPQQLERILSQFHQLTAEEIESHRQILCCYHAVYRNPGSRKPGKRCQPPTPEQYQKMAEMLCSQYERDCATNFVAVQLLDLANRLREYRIYVRGKYLSTQSLDTGESESWAARIPAPTASENENETEVSEFLNVYRQQLILGFNASLAEVTNRWVDKIKRRDKVKSQQFLQALHLFHCEGKSMGEIAKIIGLQAQYQVSRLLKLKSFRAEIRQNLVNELQQRLLDFLKNSNTFDSERLAEIHQPLVEALDEQINQLMADAESDAHTAKENTTETQFSLKLCSYLDKNMKIN